MAQRPDQFLDLPPLVRPLIPTGIDRDSLRVTQGIPKLSKV